MGYVLAFLLGMVCMGFVMRAIASLLDDDRYL